ncbi:hypothetical protein OIE62_03775 [Streptomyces scopuliridis]|uniref:Uncharacterized protein n=1 Tax=Streptomyces scopuliridis TaxID=452529 RepID=A0ACD4ZY44_9ACTN|nr:hypothetical protein [Streptomyces scopuliridis]WSB38924.1 hypothetical protein OG949_36460 [Streptomyces scopuliridis]WSC03365.1 hypothetical protein OG835_38055 [Streptomyces scopuliridis]WSC10759.1 hypothetical protein OIE62_03775 [Streptomyces scopuliridis]
MGAVESNIGHTQVAAGAAGVIETWLGTLPADGS